MLNRKINLKGATIILASVFITSLTSGPAIAQVDILQPSKANQTTGITSLMSAVMESDIEGVKFFVRSQPENINSQNIGGATALHIASRNHDTKIVRILIENGADVNLKDNEGWTPLMRASLSKDAEVVDILLANGARLLEENQFKETAIIHAANADCDLCLGLMMNKVNLESKAQKKHAKKQINDAFIIARNHGNFEAQDILKSGIDDIFESEERRKEAEKQLAAKQKAEELAAAREKARKNAEEKLLREKLAQRQAEQEALELEKVKAEAQRILQEKIAQQEAEKKALELEKARIAKQQQEKNAVETVSLSLGDDKKGIEGVSAFKQEEDKQDIASVTIPKNSVEKKSGGFFFGLFGGSHDIEEKVEDTQEDTQHESQDANQVAEIQKSNDVTSHDIAPVTEERIVEDIDIPEPTKIIDRENEVKEVITQGELKVADLLTPVVAKEKIIDEKPVALSKEAQDVAVDKIVTNEVDHQEVSQLEDQLDQDTLEPDVSEEKVEKSGSFFARLFGFGKKEKEDAITENVEEELVEETQPIEEIQEVANIVKTDAPNESQPVTPEDKTPVVTKEAVIDHTKEAETPKKKRKKFKFKAGPSVMKPQLEVSEPPVTPEEIEQEEEAPEVKKSFFSRLFSWFGSDDQEEKKLEEETTTPETEEIIESQLEEIQDEVEEEEVESEPAAEIKEIEETTQEEKPEPKLIEVRPITEPEPKSSFFSLFSNDKNAFSEQDLDEIVENHEESSMQEKPEEYNETDVEEKSQSSFFGNLFSNSNDHKDDELEEAAIQEEIIEEETDSKAQTVDEVEDEVAEEIESTTKNEVKEKDSGFSFFGLFSHSDEEQDSIDEEISNLTKEVSKTESDNEVVSEVKEEELAPVNKKTRKFHFKKGPSLPKQSVTQTQVEESKEEVNEKKKSGFFDFLFGKSDKEETTETPVEETKIIEEESAEVSSQKKKFKVISGIN